MSMIACLHSDYSEADHVIDTVRECRHHVLGCGCVVATAGCSLGAYHMIDTVRASNPPQDGRCLLYKLTPSRQLVVQ